MFFRIYGHKTKWQKISMENIERLPLVLCLTIGGVLFINAAILVWFRRKQSTGEFHLLGNLTANLRNPNQKANDEMQELSRLVAELKSDNSDQPQEDKND
jgi:hypothetical protein